MNFRSGGVLALLCRYLGVGWIQDEHGDLYIIVLLYYRIIILCLKCIKHDWIQDFGNCFY